LSAVRKTVPSILCLIACLAASQRTAYSGDDAARRSAVVVKQGTTSLTVAQVEDGLARVPTFQLPAFGKTEDEIRRTFLEKQVLPDLLLARAAEKGSAGSDAWVSLKVKQATGNAARRNAPVPPATREEIDAYYTQHKEAFSQEERILVWRILIASRDEAVVLLKNLKTAGTVKAFTEAARDKSLDKASYLRSGNLGFLLPDGTSVEAKLKMDPALVKAARTVKDGEFVPEVVPEGEAFAIVWRRGSTARTEVTVDKAEATIREKLERSAREKADRALIERLRKERLTEVDTAGLGAFEVDIGTGSIFVKK
jgi:peptidyl-prolyl cis-trans isomerase C